VDERETGSATFYGPIRAPVSESAISLLD